MRVSVVIPYYEQPAQLALMVAALEAQTWPRDALELVIADDGSATPPILSSSLPTRVVWQEDRGFRAAAARNLGYRAATGDIVCFLDCDTIPEPEYVERAVAPVLEDPSTLVVGRRLHRHLTGPRAGESLPEPAWLREAYARTDDLENAGDDGYRYVISAVLTMSRRLLELTGGFDEGFTAYGGEDWELAWRCWNAGARLRHVPEAIAIHDGPDWAGRTADLAAKNEESQRLARLIPHREARPGGVRFRRTEVIADLRGLGSGPDVVVSAGDLLRYGDITVLLDDVPDVLAEDPRVVTELAADIRRSARVRVGLAEAVRVSVDELSLLTDLVSGGLAFDVVRQTAGGTTSAPQVSARVRTTRSMARERYWGDRPVLEQITMSLRTASEQTRLEALWGGWA